MAATFTVGGGNATVTFSWTKPTAIAQATINSAAHYFVHDDAAFDVLTSQQKLDILYADARTRIISLAHTYDVATATEAARVAAEATATANIDL